MDIEELFPKKPTLGLPDRNVRNGIRAFIDNDFKAASSQFNQALRQNPANSYLQFLNGLTYHLRAESGEVGQYEFARLGYELALRFDKSNYLAAQQLARYHLKHKNYKLAQGYFAHALLYRPDDGELLYGLAKSSYYSGDMETAIGAVRKASEIRANDPVIISGDAVISAALGDFDAAAVRLAEFRRMEPTGPRIERVEERIRDWEQLYRSSTKESVTLAAADEDPWAGVQETKPETKTEETKTESKTDTKVEGSAPATGPSSEPKMVVIDVTMIRTEEDAETNKGLNLLDGLKLQFDGKVSYSDNFPPSNGVGFSRAVTGNFTIPQLNYNLNIFNSSFDRNEVIAQPTIIAMDGKESKFFAGTTLNVAITGSEHGTMEKIDTGIILQVTPTFLPDGSIQLSLLASRSSPDKGNNNLGGWNISIVNLAKNEITANVVMKFGQTLVLSGLREKELSETKSGVPLLMDIPFVQYLFSNKTTSDIHTTILILLTPRRVLPGINVSEAREPTEAEQKTTEEYKKKHRYIFEPRFNLGTVMHHLEKHKLMRDMVMYEIRDTDLAEANWWGSIDSLGMMLKRAVSFLYY
jgi:Flp pilus assembly protein TadD